jgi:hypothetical protein
MKLDISEEIVKKFKSLNECCDFGKEELREYLNELAEELLMDYVSEELSEQGNFNDEDYEE